MNKFTQYIPAFVEGFSPEIVEFETTEELLNTDTLRRVAASPSFSNFVLDNHTRNALLLAEFNDGIRYVVGFLDSPERVDFSMIEQ